MFLHHANVLEGEKDTLLPILVSFLEEQCGVSYSKNPNLTEMHVDTFGIADSRFLIERQSSTAFGERAKKIFIVSAFSFTAEAQNALLKVLEEPTKDTHFFIFVRSQEFLLPTLRSRLFPLSLTKFADVSLPKSESAAKKFLDASPRERLTMVEKLVDKKNTPKEDAPRLLTALEQELYKEYVKKEGLERLSFRSSFQSVWRAKQLLHAPGVGAKLVLEELALTL